MKDLKYIISSFCIIIISIIFISCNSDNPTQIQHPEEYLPYNPSPLMDFTLYSDTVVLSWDFDQEGTYDIYVGTNYGHLPRIDSNLSVNSYFIDNLTMDKRYFWQIIAKYGDDTTVSPIWSFYTRSKVMLFLSPIPEDGERRVNVNQTVTWDMFSNPPVDIKYDVFFDTLPEPTLVSENQSHTFFNPGKLLYDTEYYWQVIAISIDGDTSISPIWSFKTAQKLIYFSYIDPAYNSGFASTNQLLSWRIITNLEDQLRFDVYFDTLPDPELVSINQSDRYYDPGEMLQDKFYYWKLNTFDNDDDTVFGQIWQFKTEPLTPVYAVMEITQYLYGEDRRSETFRVRFDSAYSPDEPYVLLNPSSIEVKKKYSLNIDSQKEWYQYIHQYWEIGNEELVEFNIEGNFDVPDLKTSMSYYACPPKILSPMNTDYLSISGFNITWENSCTGMVQIIITNNYSLVEIVIETDNDGSYYVTSEKLTDSLLNSIYDFGFSITVIAVNEEFINAPNFDSRSVKRSISSQRIPIVFIDSL